MARNTGVKVVINGQSVDELFCGYRYYYEIWLRELYESGDYERLAEELELFNKQHATTYTINSEEFRHILGTEKMDLVRASDGTFLDGRGCLTSDFFTSHHQERFRGEFRFLSLTKNRIYNDLCYLKIPKLLMFQDKTPICQEVYAHPTAAIA